MKPSYRAFSLLELVVLVIGLAALICLVVPVLGQTRVDSRQTQDGTQIRQILSAMQTWAGNNQDQLPRPSLMDPSNTTIGTSSLESFKKDNTGNVLSLLIWNKLITPEMCVSTAESAPNVRIDAGYQYANPASASNPARATWDPGFAGTPIDTAGPSSGHGNSATARDMGNGIGNQSYAHTPIIATCARGRVNWNTTPGSRSAIIGNRGPKWYATNNADQASWPSAGWRLDPFSTGISSNSLRIHGPLTSWEGNIAYGDGAVHFETRPDPVGVTYLRRTGPTTSVATPDNLFVDENDDASGSGTGQTSVFMNNTNQYLRPIGNVTGTSITVFTIANWVD